MTMEVNIDKIKNNRPAFLNELMGKIDKTVAEYLSMEPCVLTFAKQKVERDGLVYDQYDYFTTIGDVERHIETIDMIMRNDKKVFDVLFRSVMRCFIDHYAADDRDPVKRDLRRALLRTLGKNEDKQPLTQREEASRYVEQIAREHPEREDQIRVIQARIKQHRKAGLQDLALYLEDAIEEIRREAIAEEEKLVEQRLANDHRKANLEEAARVKTQYYRERQEQLRFKHDYDAMGRRVRNYRTMIERLTKEMEAIQEAQRQMQSNCPQFDPNSAAKKKRQQLAERKRERAAHKKKGKEDATPIRSCSPMMAS